MQELAGALLAVAEILDNAEQFSLFEDRFVPRQIPPDKGTEDRATVEKMFAELEATEQQDRNTSQF